MKTICHLTDRELLGSDAVATAPPRYTARAILRNREGNYAVLYSRDFDFYSFPGGGIEKGEDPIAALTREVYEETGCTADRITPLGKIVENRGHANYTQISYYYAVLTESTSLSPHFTEAEAHYGARVSWLSLQEMCEKIRAPLTGSHQLRFLKARDIAALDAYLKTLS
ncbi:MAG: NUDIX domain-containing protein [Clostridia bacterium]|nr:NUDIX domain-containing protein [Clostridia bacterium]